MPLSSLEHEEQIAILEAKYEEICLQKGVNDQQLIETTNRLSQIEKELKNTQIEFVFKLIIIFFTNFCLGEIKHLQQLINSKKICLEQGRKWHS